MNFLCHERKLFQFAERSSVKPRSITDEASLQLPFRRAGFHDLWISVGVRLCLLSRTKSQACKQLWEFIQLSWDCCAHYLKYILTVYSMAEMCKRFGSFTSLFHPIRSCAAGMMFIFTSPMCQVISDDTIVSLQQKKSIISGSSLILWSEIKQSRCPL